METLDNSSLSCSLEITILSAEDLRMNGRPVKKKKTFVTIETGQNNAQSTSTSSTGGSHPSWNEKLQFSLLCNSIENIKLIMKCKTSSGVKVIGSVCIPLSDFLEDYVPPNCLHFLSYRLREHDGDRNGIVNISIRVKGADRIPRTVPSSIVQTGYRNSNAVGWMPQSRNHRQDAYTRNNGGIAVGIPVTKRYMV
ncbi:hypothetical protein ACHQM5_000787 [Ranunculus cassubicifolius]